MRFAAPEIDGAAVMRRVREERDRFAGFVVQAVEAWPVRHRARAYARFRSDHELELSDVCVVEAERIVIATGSRTNVLPIFEAFGDRAIVNDDVFSWETLPGSIAVFGAGVIGLELGQALHRLGVRVTIFGRDHLVGPISDPEVRAAAADIFTAEMAFLPHAEVTRRASPRRASRSTTTTAARPGRNGSIARSSPPGGARTRTSSASRPRL